MPGVNIFAISHDYTQGRDLYPYIASYFIFHMVVKNTFLYASVIVK